MGKKTVFLIIFIIVFISNDTVLFNTSGISLLPLLMQFIYGGIILTCILNFNKRNSKPLFLMVLIFLIVINSLLHQDYSLGYFIQINALLTAYFITRNISFESFTNYYCKILYYISIASVIFFFLFIIFPNVISFFTIHHNTKEVPYINLYFYVHFVTMFRNTGIFREPGVFMIYLNLAIMLELFIKKTINKKALFVYIIAILTTLSTAGFIILIIIGLLYFIKGNESKMKFQGILFLMIIGYFILGNFELFESTFRKFDSTSNEYASSVARSASVQIPFAMFLDSPLIGTGLSNFEELYEQYSRDIIGTIFKSGSHSTNTFFNALATYGFFYFIMLLYLFTSLTKLFFTNFLSRLIILSIFALMFSNEDLRYSLLFLTLLFYGIKNHQKSIV